jgi:hypothetical protein
VGETRYDRNSYPRFIGDGMSKLTGSVAPIDHGLAVTLRVTRKSIMFISKSTTTRNQPPSCCGGLPRRLRCPPELRVPQGRLITSGGRSSTTNTSWRAVLRAPMTGWAQGIPARPRRYVGRSGYACQPTNPLGTASLRPALAPCGVLCRQLRPAVSVHLPALGTAPPSQFGDRRRGTHSQ